MIQTETIVRVIDNAGAREAKCIRNLGGFYKKTGRLGHLIVVAVNKKHINTEKLTKKVYFGLIVNVKKNIRRLNGFYLKFDQNAIVLLNESFDLLGTRVDGIIPQEFRKTRYSKLTGLCKGLI